MPKTKQEWVVKDLGLNRTHIYRCLQGERKTTAGYSFKYGEAYKQSDLI